MSSIRPPDSVSNNPPLTYILICLLIFLWRWLREPEETLQIRSNHRHSHRKHWRRIWNECTLNPHAVGSWNIECCNLVFGKNELKTEDWRCWYFCKDSRSPCASVGVKWKSDYMKERKIYCIFNLKRVLISNGGYFVI